ncbi:hypothetical protein BYT27DRAFT_7343421 [Phlegmacium glaucopus]|nr:hypothetical protein BYT27DRAFT_7343421 [Phlegmacium glaucopus]
MKFALLSSLALVACIVHAAPLGANHREVDLDGSDVIRRFPRYPESALIRKECVPSMGTCG